MEEQQDDEPQGTARINIMLYKCGRKLILRAARVYTAPTRASTTTVAGGRTGSSRGGSSRGGGSREVNRSNNNLLSPNFMLNSGNESALSLIKRGWDTKGGIEQAATNVDELEDYPDKGLWHDPRLDGGGYCTVLPAGKWAKNSLGSHPTWAKEGWGHCSKSWAEGRMRSSGYISTPSPPVLLLPSPSKVQERAMVAMNLHGNGGSLGKIGTGNSNAVQDERGDPGRLHAFKTTLDDRQHEPRDDSRDGGGDEQIDAMDLPGGGWIPNEVCVKYLHIRLDFCCVPSLFKI